MASDYAFHDYRENTMHRITRKLPSPPFHYFTFPVVQSSAYMLLNESGHDMQIINIYVIPNYNFHIIPNNNFLACLCVHTCNIFCLASLYFCCDIWYDFFIFIEQEGDSNFGAWLRKSRNNHCN